MSNPHLPPEILDYVIDLLRDEPETLRRCCLVSRSWVPRTRRHLFANIKFSSASDLRSWKKAFPDVSNSPAYHAHTLLIRPRLVTASDAEEGGWIRAFSGVVSLVVDSGTQNFRPSEASLAPFFKFSPSLNSLRIRHIVLPFPQVFDLIPSSPLLEDLGLKGRNESRFNEDDPYRPQTVVSPTSPVFTGTLEFHILGGAGNAARRLMDLPNGLHFRNLALTWDCKEDHWWITELVAKCSHTLQSLDITCLFRRM